MSDDAATGGISSAIDDANSLRRGLGEALQALSSLRARIDALEQPAYCYDVANWEVTYAWSDRTELTEQIEVGEIREIGMLARLPSRFAVRAAPDDECTTFHWCATREEAERLLETIARGRAEERES